MRRRTRILMRDAAAAAVAVVVVVAAVVGGIQVDHHLHGRPAAARSRTGSAATRPSISSTASSSAAASTAATTPLGVYAGPGGAAGALAAGRTLAGQVRYALDFLPAHTWTQLTNPSWFAQTWGPTPLHLVIGVPMLPTVGGTMALGAAGAYDGQFTLLAQQLVAAGLGSAILMIGWQPYSSENRWQVTTPAQAGQYVAFWDHIKAAMAAVTGAQFRYEWDAGTLFGGSVDPAQTYPGNGAVDIVATDAFDVGLGSVAADQQWPVLLDQPYGPGWVAAFATAHHKAFALAMTGLAPASANGGGDNAAFLSSSYEWAASVHAVMDMLWDAGAAALSGGTYPQALASLDKIVGQGRRVGAATASH